MEIKAIAHIDGKILQCQGKIEIRNTNDKQAYVSWQISHNDQLLASKSENIFIDLCSREGLIEKIIDRIENYRMNRRKIFFSVSIN